jgi:hypothetical protein
VAQAVGVHVAAVVAGAEEINKLMNVVLWQKFLL